MKGEQGERDREKERDGGVTCYMVVQLYKINNENCPSLYPALPKIIVNCFVGLAWGFLNITTENDMKRGYCF